jgi:hypothetical protein
MTTITTEDNVVLELGAHAYDYYSMKPGRISDRTEDLRFYNEDENPNPKRDIWFKFHHDDGTWTLLNGERICSDEFAKRRKFFDA